MIDAGSSGSRIYIYGKATHTPILSLSSYSLIPLSPPFHPHTLLARFACVCFTSCAMLNVVLFIYIYTYVHTHLHTYTFIYIYTQIYLCMYRNLYTFIYIFIYIYLYLFYLILEWPHRDQNVLPLVEPFTINQTAISKKTNVCMSPYPSLSFFSSPSNLFSFLLSKNSSI